MSIQILTHLLQIVSPVFDYQSFRAFFYSRQLRWVAVPVAVDIAVVVADLLTLIVN